MDSYKLAECLVNQLEFEILDEGEYCFLLANKNKEIVLVFMKTKSKVENAIIKKIEKKIGRSLPT